MIVAKLFPEPSKGGRGKKNPLLSNGFNQGEISKARLVLKVLPELADQVISGEEMLNAGDVGRSACRLRSRNAVPALGCLGLADRP